MNRVPMIWVGIGTLVGAVALATVASPPAGASAPPPEKDVVVVNTPANPVPITGAVTVSGATTISGTVSAAQAGAWSVGASQSGPWLVGIDPAHNTVSLGAWPTFYFDSGFAVINDGTTLDLGPFDLSQVRGARIVVHAVNGDIRAKVRANTPDFSFDIDEFVADGESGPDTKTFVYEYPPPSVTIRLTEGGPGGSNYQVLVIGR